MDEDKPLAESVGERLARLRKAKGLSPADLAAALNLTEQAIKKLESGGSGAPSFENGLLLAAALEQQPWVLAFGETWRENDRVRRVARRVKVRVQILDEAEDEAGVMRRVVSGETELPLTSRVRTLEEQMKNLLAGAEAATLRQAEVIEGSPASQTTPRSPAKKSRPASGRRKGR